MSCENEQVNCLYWLADAALVHLAPILMNNQYFQLLDGEIMMSLVRAWKITLFHFIC